LKLLAFLKAREVRKKMVNLGEVVSKEEEIKPLKPLPEDWYKGATFLTSREEEPSPYRLMFDWILGGGMDAMENIIGALGIGGPEEATLSIPPELIQQVAPMAMKMIPMLTSLGPMIILMETINPRRGREHLRISTSPFGILEGAPAPGSKIEPDIVIRMEYDDLIRMLTGEMSMIDPFIGGRIQIEGNIGGFMMMGDMMDTMTDMMGTMLGEGALADMLGLGGEEGLKLDMEGIMGGITSMMGGGKKEKKEKKKE
jgi:hypothetical protein